MGRMLDAFHKGRAKQGSADTPVPTLHTVWPEEEAEELAAVDNDIPYIEVGGPREAGEEQQPLGIVGDWERSLASAVLPVSLGAPLPKNEPQWMTVRFHPLAVAQPASASRFAPELIAFHQPDHAISGQYRDLTTGLLTQTPTEQPRVLLFSSAASGAGTTTVVLNTAVTLARDNLLRVVVVDTHLRRPAVNTRLGMRDGPGLREVLGGRVSLEEAVQTTGLPGLSVLSAGKDESVSSARLVGERMRAVLDELRERHDVVLVDGASWDGRPEVVSLGCACDAVYLCLTESQENSSETAELLQIVAEQGASVRGCIITHR